MGRFVRYRVRCDLLPANGRRGTLPGMDLLTFIIITIVGLGVLTYLIYVAVLAALREHSVWSLAGGAERRLKERQDRYEAK